MRRESRRLVLLLARRKADVGAHVSVLPSWLRGSREGVEISPKRSSCEASGRCCVCLLATATVLELPPIGSSHAPALCLCTGRNGCGEVALLLVVVQLESAPAGGGDASFPARSGSARAGRIVLAIGEGPEPLPAACPSRPSARG